MAEENNKTLINKDECFVLCQVCMHPIAHCLNSEQSIVCPRCHHKNNRTKKKDSQLTMAFASTALFLYLPANLLPFMTIEMYGNKTEATIWSGIVSLAESGSWFLAIIIFIASMLVPFVKLLALFYLSATARNQKNQHFKTKLAHFIEAIGPWAMLDVFLLAVLVAVVKFDAMASVTAGAGSFLFLLVVIFTLFASANFDAKIIWEEVENENKDS